MNPYDLMKYHEKDFTKSDQRIYEMILTNPHHAITDSIVKSADLMHTSKDALLRFCKKLGYAGYKEFRFELSRYLHAGGSATLKDTSKDKRSQVIQIYKQGLDALYAQVSEDAIHEICKRILSASNIRIFALHRTGLIAEEFSYRLLKIGIPSHFHRDNVFFSSMIESSRPNELHIYISMSATMNDLSDYTEKSKKATAETVLITQNMFYKDTGMIDQYIYLPSLEFPHSEFFLDTTMLCYPLIEMIIMHLADQMIQK